MIGRSDRREVWNDSVPLDIARNAKSCSIIHNSESIDWDISRIMTFAIKLIVS